MKNIRLFETVAEFEAVKASLATPNVSLAGGEMFFLPKLGSESEPEPEPVPDSTPTPAYEMVDLGLSVKWAKCNVGAEKETDYGMYFKFGDVVGTVDGVGYDESIPAVEADSNNNLLPAYDTATQLMGEGYRMPTKEEIDELKDNTDHEVVTINDVKGMKFSKKDDVNTYIFIPFAGYYNSNRGSFLGVGSYSGLWSSTLHEFASAYMLYCDSDGNVNTTSDARYFCHTVRAVCA